jgi:ubiquinone/menaquinone biosynthesis C-methylase UbiE
MFDRYFARQLAQPSGWFGRWYLGRWFRQHTRAVNQLALEKLAPQAGDRLLEIGFGGGDLLLALLTRQALAQVVGIDHSMAMVQRTRRRLRRFLRQGQVELACASVAAIPYPDGRFTRIVSVNTLYFWPDPALALAECRRVLGDGGRFLLCFDAREDLERWPGHVYGFRLYDPEAVEKLFRAARFEVLELATRLLPGYGQVHCLTAQVAP